MWENYVNNSLNERVEKVFKPIVEFCRSNLSMGSAAALNELEASSETDVIEYGCLGYCGECALQPYALVEGEMVIGSTSEQLLDKINKKINDKNN